MVHSGAEAFSLKTAPVTCRCVETFFNHRPRTAKCSASAALQWETVVHSPVSCIVEFHECIPKARVLLTAAEGPPISIFCWDRPSTKKILLSIFCCPVSM
ncbi:hypothetical protein Plhal304r1_c001g0004001 [Plasmopara halstedii]